MSILSSAILLATIIGCNHSGHNMLSKDDQDTPATMKNAIIAEDDTGLLSTDTSSIVLEQTHFHMCVEHKSTGTGSILPMD